MAGRAAKAAPGRARKRADLASFFAIAVREREHLVPPSAPSRVPGQKLIAARHRETEALALTECNARARPPVALVVEQQVLMRAREIGVDVAHCPRVVERLGELACALEIIDRLAMFAAVMVVSADQRGGEREGVR